VVVGPDERVRGEILLRELRTGSQEAIPLQSAADVIEGRVHG
jgi:hypothetical protein